MNDKVTTTFELGPIRPPSEAYSILLRLTRNCPWNRCAFCPVYKGEKFSLRPVEDIKADIDSMARIRDLLLDRSEEPGTQSLHTIAREENIDESLIRQIAFWMNFGMESLFLQDADSLIMKTPQLVEVLLYIREKFPSIQRVTTYARAHTVSRKSDEELNALFDAGLNRIHIGMESGSDTVLELLEKGVTAERQIDAGQRAIAAGFEVSQYFMPGSGGTEYSEENALQSARVINEINPTFIRLRSTIPVPGTPLFDLMKEGKWTPVPEEEKVKEIRLFIDNLDGITSRLESDHIMNLIEDIEGSLPEDKSNMLETIDSFFSLPQEERECYIVARRLGRVRHLAGFHPTPEIIALRSQLINQYGSLDEAMMDILTNYI